MLGIFVTGDNHIGLKYANHEQAAVLAKSRIAAFENMVRCANAENCSVFVITGDLFENTYSISQKDIITLLDMLSLFNGTVAILPGNHDYYDKDVKVWRYMNDALDKYDNIMLLTEYKPYHLTADGKAVVLYPALCTSLHSLPMQNNLGWLKNEPIGNDGAYHIGIAHGAVEGETIDNEGRYFLMKRSELESIPVDVWLIGHTHVPFPNNLTETFTPCEKILNAGTHVQTDVSCNTEGQCFVVEIDDEKKIRAKKFISGNLRFFRREVALSAGKAESMLEQALADIPDNSVVDVILSGAVNEEEYAQKDRMAQRVLYRFLEGTYRDYDLNKLISKELIESEFPETSFSAEFLSALLTDSKEAQLAYELLQALKEEK